MKTVTGAVGGLPTALFSSVLLHHLQGAFVTRLKLLFHVLNVEPPRSVNCSTLIVTQCRYTAKQHIGTYMYGHYVSIKSKK